MPKTGLYALLLIPLLYWSELLFLHTTPKTYALFAITQILLVCFLWVLARKPEPSYRLSITGKLLLLYIGILIVTSLFGADPQYSFWGSLDRLGGVLTWLHLSLAFFLATRLLTTPQDWVRFFTFSTWVACAIAALHLFSMGGAQIIPEARGGATFGNSSFLAVYLLFHFFFALYIASQQPTRKRQTLWVAVAAGLFLTTKTISALAVQYSLIGGLILLGALLLIFASRHWKKVVGWVVLSALIASFFTTTILIFRPDSAVHQAFIERSSGSRFVLWDMAWEGIKERPWLGWGLENFGIVALENYRSCLGSQECGYEIWFDRAHSKILDVWIESGIFGLLAYIGLFIAALFELDQTRRKKQITPLTYSIFVSLLATYFVQNLTVLDTNTSLLFWILILAFASSMNQMPNAKQTVLSRIVALSALILLPVCLFFFVIQPLRGNLAFAKTLNATSLEARVEAYGQATTLSPLGIDTRRVLLSDQTARVLWKIPQETLKGIESMARVELSLAQAGLQDSLAHKNQELHTHIALGIMYQTEGHFFDSGAFAKAEAILQEAIDLYPAVAQPRWILAGVYLDQGKFEEALAMTQSVLDFSPESPHAYNYQLIVLKWKGDEEAFETLASLAVELIPDMEEDIEKLRSLDLPTQAQEVLMLFHR